MPVGAAKKSRKTRGRRAIKLAWAASALLLLGACSDASRPASSDPRPRESAASDPQPAPGDEKESDPKKHAGGGDKGARLIDPRKGGFEITLGEWAVTPEAPAVRPGPVTFVVRNRGTMAHGFEIELEGDSSGSGSGDIFKAEGELLQPGESARLKVNLLPGVHKIECLVEGHDDLGMEGPLEVRKDAPFLKEKTEKPEGRVSISNFEFDPETTTVPAGTEVEWHNDDPSAHTVTSLDGTFDSGTLDASSSFSFRFEDAGTYAYRCDIHPEMKGKVTVE